MTQEEARIQLALGTATTGTLVRIVIGICYSWQERLAALKCLLGQMK